MFLFYNDLVSDFLRVCLDNVSQLVHIQSRFMGNNESGLAVHIYINNFMIYPIKHNLVKDLINL